MSDRIAVMNRGRYEQLADPETLYERPTTRFVAGLPRHLQPPARDRRREGRPLRRRPPDGRHGRPDPRGAVSESRDRRGRRAAGEDPHVRPPAPPPRRASTSWPGPSATRPTSASARSTSSRPAAAGGVTVYEQNVERTIHGSLYRPARTSGSPGRPTTPSPSPHPPAETARRELIRPTAASGATGRSRCPSTIRSSDRRITRRTVLQGGALAGVGAFLAACGTPPGRLRRSHRRPERRAEQRALGLRRADRDADRRAPSSTSPTGRSTSTRTRATRRSQPHPRAVHREVRHEGQLRRGHQRQRPVLRHDPAARSRPGRTPAGTSSSLTDWMAARLIRLGWVETIDTANTPNFVANLRDVYKGVAWDPDTNLRAPWQSGMTGLGFDEATTGAVDQPRRAVDRRPALEGQGLVPHRDARQRRPDAAQARLQARGLHARAGGRGDRRDPEGRRRRHRPELPGQRLQGRAWSRATSSWAWRGRAT